MCSAEYARELFVSRTFAEVLVGTGPQKKCAGKFLTGDSLAVVKFCARELQQVRERAEVTGVELWRKVLLLAGRGKVRADWSAKEARLNVPHWLFCRRIARQR